MADPVILIPARWASVRFPGKPLHPLRGPDGTKPLVQRSWEAACTALPPAQVHICTDDARIADTAHGFGAQVIMTDSSCVNGTERCAQAVLRERISAEIVINFQGDACLTPPWVIPALVSDLTAHPDADMSTPILDAPAHTRAALLADRAAGRVGGTTAVTCAKGYALYFSKEVLPHGTGPAPTSLHLGIYAYRRDRLLDYPTWPEGVLERHEALEQLRFLERGARVHCARVDAKGRNLWELNNPSDVPMIEAELERLGHACD